MFGQGGKFNQQNMVKRKAMSIREWAELCNKPDFAAPGVDDVDLRKPDGRATRTPRRTRKSAKAESQPAEDAGLVTPPQTVATPPAEMENETSVQDQPRKTKGRRPAKEIQEEKERKDAEFFEDFDPEVDWLPPNTTPYDYTPEFCSKLERHYWRNLILGKSAWYGADTAGTCLVLVPSHIYA